MPSLTKVQPAFILAQGAIELDSGTASAPSLKFATSSATGMFSPSTGALAFSTGSTQNALTILSGGNVGIGTTNPIQKLDVNGVARASTFISTSYSVFSSIVAADPGSNYYSWNNRIGGGLAVVGTTFLDGNVGIGTTNPTRKLDVQIETASLAVGSVLSSHPIAEFINLSGSAARGLEIGSPADSVTSPVYLKVSGTGNRFAILNQSDSEQLTILNSGNVGIGITNPVSKLSIGTSGTDRISIDWIGSGGPYAVATIQANMQSGEVRMGAVNTAGTHFVTLYSNNSEALRILSSGNIGIGTTNPSERLHVQGTGLFTSRLTSGQAIIASNESIDPDSFTNKTMIGAIADGSGWGVSSAVGGNAGTGDSWAIGHNGGALFFGMQNGTADNTMQTYMQFETNRNLLLTPTSGNVGIGTTNPQTKLGVYSASDDDGLTLEIGRTPSSGEGPAVTFRHNTNNGTSRVFAKIKSRMRSGNDVSWGSDLSLYTGGNALAENLTVRGDGNVGIGTTTPASKLEVAGIVSASSGLRTLEQVRAMGWWNTPTGSSYSGLGVEMGMSSGHGYILCYNRDNSTWGNLRIQGGAGSTMIELPSSGSTINVTGNIDASGIVRATGGRLVLRDDSLENHATDSDTASVVINYAGYASAYTRFRDFHLYNGKAGLILKAIGSNGNVGIGTDNPAYKLDVNGRSNFSDNMKITPTSEAWAEGLQFYMPTAGTWGGVRWVRNRTNYHGSWYQGWTALDSSNDMVFGHNASGTQTDNILRLYGSASGSARIGRDLYIAGLTGGSYGNRLVVGNTDTSYTLQDSNLRPTIQAHGAYPVISLNHTVTGNPSHGPTLQFTCNGTGNQFVIGTTGNGTRLDIGFSAAGDWNPHNGIAGYNGTTSMSFTTSGNVGIGTLNPSYKLHVQGTANVTGSFYTSYAYISGGAEINQQLYLNLNGNAYAEVLAIRGGSGSTGGAYVKWMSPSADTAYVGHKQAVLGGTGYDYTILSTTGLGFGVATNNRSTYDFYIASSGNVGIGTTNPVSKLDVRGSFLLAANDTTATHITQRPYTINNGTLSWEGSAGQLFSITNNLTTGSIFSVNDVSGIPSIDVDANGTIELAPFGGNVGVGTTNPTTKLHVIGDILASGNVTAYSDLQLKDNIKSIDNAIDKVLALRGVSFTRIDTEDKDKKHIGVIAQEVEQVLPEVVQEHSDGIKSVAYGNMVGLLIEAIKEQQSQIESLKGEIKSLKRN